MIQSIDSICSSLDLAQTNGRQPGVYFFFIVDVQKESNSIHFSIAKIPDLQIFDKKKWYGVYS